MPYKIETMLMEIDIDGEDHHLEMMDGSTWFVNPGDLPTVATWLPTSTVRIEETDDDSMFSSKITNLNVDISITAMKIT